MRVERAEAAGLGVAVAAHLALLWALGLKGSLDAPPPPPMEVSFVEETGLQSASPTPEPAAQSFAPEPGAPEETLAAPAEQLLPEPPQRPIPQPVPRLAAPAPDARPSAPAPAQRRTRQTNPGTGRAEADRGSRLGPDLLKGLGGDPDSRSERAPGAVMSAQALAGIVDGIRRQVLPCAQRNRNPGPGASDIRVRINLRINRDGTLAGRPRVLTTSGVNAENARYEDRVRELAINAFIACSPLRGLPEELYRTSNGGWNNINLNYSLP